MLHELAVTDLGVIGELSLLFGPGMTAVTGETGAGKTLVVTAIELLVGGRADPGMVRPGAREAVVEGRFVHQNEEMILRRVVPARGRSRAYLDGHLATATALAEWGELLVDLHGQHAHQSLLHAGAQRAALDRYAGVDVEALRVLRSELAELDERLDALGGDERERARELDLLRYQVEEVAAAELERDEDVDAEEEEALLADAAAHREAAAGAVEALTGEAGAESRVGEALAAVAGRAPLASLEQRLRAVAAEIAEAAYDLRSAGEAIPDDPERLDVVRGRLGLINDLKRKYGATVGEIATFAAEAESRLHELETREARAGQLEQERAALAERLAALYTETGRARRKSAPSLARDATGHLASLALTDGRIEVVVPDDDPGDAVRFLFTGNPGTPLRPLSKVASGGELARLMLALRLVLTAGPEVLVFDEVDAGIGGAAAQAVGRSLSRLGKAHQVLVVTHLPQVAAHADAQVAVVKESVGGTTLTRAMPLDDDGRRREISRMLSGSPDRDAAREHAADLLATARRERAGR